MLSTLFLGVALSVAAVAEVPPNVIVFLTDDQGSMDAGCYGAADLHTPNMDALAARGVRFTQFYSGAPVCSPSRAALLTGRYPQRCGVPTNVGEGAGLPAAEVTLAETLKARGYATALLGKWHLGHAPELQPNAQGFDHAVGFLGGCIDNYSHFFYWNGPNRHDFHRNGVESHEEGQYVPALLADEAIAFIDAHRDTPFFIYHAANAPHYPYQGTEAWLKRYRDEGVPYPRDLYAAFLSSQDEAIGRVLAHLDARGLRENTIIVFQSDNGHSLEERAHFGGGSAGALRGAKFSHFEGGIRVPAIISWPGHLPEGAVHDVPAHACDWLPTIASLCGAPLLNADIDGVDLAAALHGAQDMRERVLHWQTGTGADAPWAVRSGKWKLLFRAQDPTMDPRKPLSAMSGEDEYFLADMESDPREQRNVTAEHPDVARRLRELYAAWAATLP